MKVLYCFGLNEDGQCGVSHNDFSGANKDDDNVLAPTPIYLPPQLEIVSVSCGSRHTLGLCNNGTVYSWGWGHLGQLGVGDKLSKDTPTIVKNLEEVVLISAGGMHSGCINRKGECYTWGDNTYGQSGLAMDPETVKCVKVPTRVIISETSTEIKKLSCGGMHTAYLDKKGAVYCSGKAENGQTGSELWYRDYQPALFRPQRVSDFYEVADDINCGAFYTLILTETGKVFAMGKMDFGVLGIGDNISSAERPMHLEQFSNENCTLISCGKSYREIPPVAFILLFSNSWSIFASLRRLA